MMKTKDGGGGKRKKQVTFQQDLEVREADEENQIGLTKRVGMLEEQVNRLGERQTIVEEQVSFLSENYERLNTFNTYVQDTLDEIKRNEHQRKHVTQKALVIVIVGVVILILLLWV